MTYNKILIGIFLTLLLTATTGCSTIDDAIVSEDINVSVTDEGVIEGTTPSGKPPIYTSMYESSLAQFRLPESGDTVVTLVTNYGDIHLLMLPEAAPKAVENFITLGKDGYYDDVIFHRIIENFMIQGGDPDGTGRGGESIWGENFEDEFVVDYFPLQGTLAMANAGAGTNGSQFFIVHSSDYTADWSEAMADFGFDEEMVSAYETLGGTPFLFNKHTVFGQVVGGMDIVNIIASVEVDGNDQPTKNVVIEDVLITVIE